MENTSCDCLKPWGSVRKIRYLEDIKSSVGYICENTGKEFDSNILRNLILLGRQKRLGLIHKHFQSVLYTPLGRASLQTRKLQITMPDTLVFLRNVGILKVKDGIVMASPLAEQLREILSQSKPRLLLIKALAESKYSAYWCFLTLLQTRASIEIPKAFASRGGNLRNELQKQGVETDVASFYTIRDLFYELGAINWYVDSEGNEKIYPTIEITKDEANSSEWQYSSSIRGLIFLYCRRININSFVTALVNSYLETTGERFDVEASLVAVRDNVCKSLKISDQQFRELIEEARGSAKNIMIKLSYGIVHDKKRNYGLKVTTLPIITFDRMALYIRLRRNESIG